MSMKNSGRRLGLPAAAVFLVAALSGPAVAAAEDTAQVMKDVGTGTAACAKQQPAGCLGFIMSIVTGSVGAKSVEQLTYDKLGEMDGKLDAITTQLATIQHSLVSISAQVSSGTLDNRVSTLTTVQNNITDGLEKLKLVKRVCIHAIGHPADSPAIASCNQRKADFLSVADSGVMHTERNLHDQLVGNSMGLSPMIPLFYDRYVSQSRFQSGALYKKMRAQLDYYQHLQAMQLVIIAEVYNSDDVAYPPSADRSVTKPALAAMITEYNRRMKQQDALLLPRLPYGQLIHTTTGKLWIWDWSKVNYSMASDRAKVWFGGAVVASMGDLHALLPDVPNLGNSSTLSDALRGAYESAMDGVAPTTFTSGAMGDMWTSTSGTEYRQFDMGPYKYRTGVVVKEDKSRGYSYIDASPYQKKIANLDVLGTPMGAGLVPPQKFFQPLPCDAGYEWWSYTGGLCYGVTKNTPADQAVLRSLPANDYASALYVRQLAPQEVAFYLGTR